MQLKHSPLLACIAFVGILPQNVDALSVARQLGFITIPLQPLQQQSDDVHPQVLLQQNINRAQRRLARMTGRAEPSSVELRDNLIKRLKSIHGLDNRYLPYNNSSAVAPAAAGVTFANPSIASHSLGLSIVGYLATVQIGTPPRDFSLIVDSGSADTWVGSEKCNSQQGGGCGNHKFLGTTTSTTFVDSGVPWNVTYGSGFVSGSKVSDRIVIAGLKLDNYQFGVADTESTSLSSASVDGLMGLALLPLSQQQNPTPIESLVNDKLLDAAITSYKIPRPADQRNDGEITFGGLDNTKFSSNTLVTLNNVSPLFWEANMDAVTVNGADVGLRGRTAILDTGTTLILVHPEDARAVHNAIPGSKPDGHGGFTVPCTLKSQVAITFGGTSFTIDPRDLAVGPVDSANPSGDCVSGIASGNLFGSTQWLVGNVFLKNVYFSTDAGKKRIQLAKLV